MGDGVYSDVLETTLGVIIFRGTKRGVNVAEEPFFKEVWGYATVSSEKKGEGAREQKLAFSRSLRNDFVW